MMDAVLIYITAADAEEAAEIAQALVEQRLAACVNVVPQIASTYWWEDEVVQDEESLLLVKTVSARVNDVIRSVKAMHGYEVPAISVFEISNGNPEYLAWLESEVRK